MGDTDRSSKTGRVRPLGNRARILPVTPQAMTSTRLEASFRSALRRQARRERQRRYEEVLATKRAGGVRERAQQDARAAADAERAKIRAERDARSRRR
jgi:hypothetical protein